MLRAGGPRAGRGQDRAARGRDRRDRRVPLRRATTRWSSAGFHAVHIPEEYGGAGADAISRVHRHRGGRPGLRVVVADPGGQQAGQPAADPVRRPRSSRSRSCRRWPPGEAMFSYALSEREAGSDAAADAHPGGARRRHLGAQRHQVLDHQRRRLDVLHGHGRDRPGQGRATASRRSSCTRTTRASRSGTKERKLGIKGSPDLRDLLRGLHDPGRPDHRRARHRLQDRAAHARPHPAGDRRAGARHRAGRARRDDRLHQAAQAVRQVDLRLPGRAVHDRRHGDAHRGRRASSSTPRPPGPSATSPT